MEAIVPSLRWEDWLEAAANINAEPGTILTASNASSAAPGRTKTK